MTENKKYYRTLTIAGSDSGGGAGIQADLKTFSALGCYGMSVITALTAQNTVAVTSIHEVRTDFIASQIDAVLDDIGADAVKIGMLHTPEVIETVAEKLRHYRIEKIVLDPVMISKSGARLLREDAVKALERELFPLALCITPNLFEASALVGRKIADIRGMEEAARELLDYGPASVIVKGGHLEGESNADCLAVRDDRGSVSIRWYEGKQISTANNHGTGCTFSSAICAFLARGEDLYSAVDKAKDYISRAIRAGAEYKLGKGHGPVHHFYATWR